VPFRSKAQQRYMFAKHPDIAKRWAKEYGVPADLPDHVKKAKARREALKR
jgi:hypothetical protein